MLAGIGLTLASTTAEAQKRQRDRISCEEIAESSHRTADLFQVIRSLRPRFLQRPTEVRSFGNSSAGNTPLAVYVDERRDAGDALVTINPMRVEEVRYLDPDQGAAAYGPHAAGGAILVKLIKDGAVIDADSTRRMKKCVTRPA